MKSYTSLDFYINFVCKTLKINIETFLFFLQTVGHVSGCHINPAVTLGMLASRYISVVRAMCYIVVQCLGGVTGAALLMVRNIFYHI